MRSLNQSDFRLRHLLDCSAHSSHGPFHVPGTARGDPFPFHYNPVLIQQQGENERKEFQAKYYVAPIM